MTYLRLLLMVITWVAGHLRKRDLVAIRQLFRVIGAISRHRRTRFVHDQRRDAMSAPITELDTLLASLEPTLNEGVYVYVFLPDGSDISGIPALCSFREQ